MTTYRLPAEWEPQSFVQLTWPNADTDWQPMLDEVYRCYLDLARQVLRFEDLLVVTPHPIEVLQQFTDAGLTDGINGHHLLIADCPINDTWARDHGFITLLSADGTPLLCDFCFNGWGLKFAANHDNQINRHLLESLWEEQPEYYDLRSVVLEGGSIESDGEGTLLTTTSCLLAPNRNNFATKAEAEEMLRSTLAARHILWLDHGDLSGDDTDGHIDTLARLCPADTIVYVQCTDPSHPDYAALHAMELELHELRTARGESFRLLPLPMAPRRYDADGALLPATYANFLIVNGAVLMPTYRDAATDNDAMAVLQTAFPGREIVGVDCSVLIEQHGSLHCVTMQFPEAVKIYSTKKN
jgi:agmatine/peptidylarginine deiminase